MKKEDIDILKRSLPKYPNILGKELYFNAAVLIPLIEMKGELCFLFEKRAPHIRQGGEIGFPGGEYDPKSDRNCLEAAIRETEEELGIKRENIEIIGRLDTLISPRGITVDSFVGVLNNVDLKKLNIDKNEVENVFLMPVSWFENNPPLIFKLKTEIKPYYYDKNGKKVILLPVSELGLPKRYENPWEGMEHRVLVYKTEREVIWGITAELVYEIVKKLKSY